MKAAHGIAAVVVLALAGAAAWHFWPRSAPPPPPPAAPAPATPPKPAGPRFPIAAEPTEKPLPPLKESDAAMVGALSELIGNAAVQKFLRVEDLVRRIVATVDNLPREAYSPRLNPAQPVGGGFATTGREATLAIAPQNSARYAAQVALLESVDTAKAVALYRRWYPLFQQAYEELGYPGLYFNDRLIEVIDHLLDAPEPQAPVRLTQPRVMYEYADPELEARSGGQKVLMRMGAANAKRVKAKLAELRREIAAQGPRP